MNAMMPLTAIVLAAGASARMGGCKPLLPIQGVPMLTLTIRKLVSFSFEKIICITGHWHQEIVTSVQVDDPRVEWVYNPSYAAGQSTSLQKAAECCSDGSLGCLVFLADMPFVALDTIERVLQEAQRIEDAGTKCVIQPVCFDQPGHPVFFSKSMLAHFDELKGDVGAKPIMKYADKHVLIPVQDEGTLLDLDTMEQYERYR